MIDDFGIPQISTGDILRGEVKAGTALGKKAKSFMDAGDLVPDDLILEMVKGRLAKDDCAKGFILDGFPRTIPQAQGLEPILKEIGKNLDAVVSIEVDDEELVKRLTARWMSKDGTIYNMITNPPPKEKIASGEVYQRDDDKEDTVRNRLKVYKDKTEPLINFYKGKSILVGVPGNSSPDDVFNSMKQALDDKGLQ
jgi:adenylate kinase